MRTRLKGFYVEFPTTFWTLIGATFIDRLGGALLFPFFALYITDHFGVGMTEVGVLFALFAGASVVGAFVGGGLTDKLGRRWMLIFGLVISATSSLLMGIVDDLTLFYILAVFVGLLSNTGGPAQQAMVADLLPEAKHAEGYGILRVVANLAVTIGPAIGGLVANRSYLMLFVLDAASSIVTAILVFILLPETKPAVTEDSPPEENVLQTMKGYGRILQDRVFVAFWLVTALSVMVYTQMNSTLSVYLRDAHGVSTQGFGAILSLNAGMVVLFQFPITRRISHRPPLLVIALGTALYGVGFAMYGIVAAYPMFLLAMVIITIGEMLISPVAQALVAHFAPADMRGRYMAAYGFSWSLSFATAPLLAGLIMDNFNPDWVWYLCGIVSAISVAGFMWLQLRAPVPAAAEAPGV